MRQLAMVLDCEAIGLHGQAFAYGYVVLDLATGELRDARRRWCDHSTARGMHRNLDWVLKNVPMIRSSEHSDSWWAHQAFWREQAKLGGFLDDADARSRIVGGTRDLRDDFWAAWSRWSERVDLWADVAWPVEARFLVECVEDGRDAARHYSGPYPLRDVSTILGAHGDPLPCDVADLPVVKSETIRPNGVTETFCGDMLSSVWKHDPLGDAYVSAQRLLHAVRRNNVKIET